MRRASTGQAREDAIGALASAYRTYALTHPGRYGYVMRAPTPDDAAWEAAAAEILSILDDVFTGYGITGADAVDAARFVRSALQWVRSAWNSAAGSDCPSRPTPASSASSTPPTGHSVTGDPPNRPARHGMCSAATG